MNEQRRVLIVSPYFPPSSLAGVHRARHLAKHLPAVGWEPVVLTVDERHYGGPLDPALAALVPPATRIVRTGAVPLGLSRAIGVGDLGLRAYRSLRREAGRIMAAERIDAMLITGAPFYPMLMARAVQRRFRVPVVLDFQDPWVSNWGATQPAMSKAGLSHRLATALEPRAVRAAAFVTSVSDVQNAEMAARYPWRDSAALAAIPIGGDPDDFAALRSADPRARPAAGTGVAEFAYVGTFMPRSGPLFRTFFRALRGLRDARPDLAARVRLTFVGTSNQTSGAVVPLVVPIAAEEGVADLVTETPLRVPYLDALRALARADAVLLIGSDEPHYTASKIYPALMSARPFLSLFHFASSAHAILAAAGGGVAVPFDPAAPGGSIPAIMAGLSRLLDQPASLGVADPASYAAFHAGSIAARFAEVFGRVAAGSGR